VKKLFSFVKIEHTLFSLPLIYSGVLLGSKDSLPSLRVLILALTAATGARTVAFAINRIIDRHIDSRNPRTAKRDLPSGRMTLWEAVWVTVAGLALYCVSAYFISDFCFRMSPIPLAVFVIYLVLGLLYESFIHPFTILSGLPAAGLGALLTLMLFRQELNIYAFVGVIMLVGLVKKNGIEAAVPAAEVRATGAHG